MPNTERFIEIDGQQIAVTEEVYRAYKRPLWAEHKRQEREKRCKDENGNRCMRDCSRCQKERTGSTLSLDGLGEDGYEPSDPTDITEIVAYNILLEQLYTALLELDPTDRMIAMLVKEGLSEREIAAEVGLSQKGVNKRKTKMFAWLRERLRDYR
jgi:RNA polymerase sigma factor (sigma-70 family)